MNRIPQEPSSFQTVTVVKTPSTAENVLSWMSYACVAFGAIVCLFLIGMALWAFYSPNCHPSPGPFGSCGFAGLTVLIFILPLACVITIVVFAILRSMACCVGSEKTVFVTHPEEMLQVQDVSFNVNSSPEFPTSATKDSHFVV